MATLSILLADDHLSEVQDAQRALIDMGHNVITAGTFDHAMTVGQDRPFDIAVIDLGWFTDTALVSQDKDQARAAGWKLIDQVRAKNPGTVAILYSARIDDPAIKETATTRGVYCVKKTFTPEGRERLADVVTVVAHRLTLERQLYERVKEQGDRIRQLESDRDEYRERADRATAEESRFRRVLLTVVTLPSVAFALFIATWLTTQQLPIAVGAFMGGAFLTLAALKASGNLSGEDLKSLGDMLPSLFKGVTPEK